MAQDREVLRMIWEGQIPVSIAADPDEIQQIQKPENFLIMLSRLSYLPLVTEKVKKYFSRFITNEQREGNIWFDYNGSPLKQHFPIGVLFDLLHSEEVTLPWCLTIHFSNFPEDTLVKFSKRDVIEAHFMSCLKEADVLKHRGQIISAMQKRDHNQLWLGFLNDKFDQFWAINRRLMDSNGEQEHFKHIPVRFYTEDTTYIQKLISPVTESGQKKTLGNVLEELTTSSRKAVGARTHGINIHTETKIQWMSEHLSYPDNFLHLIVLYENV